MSNDDEVFWQPIFITPAGMHILCIALIYNEPKKSTALPEFSTSETMVLGKLEKADSDVARLSAHTW